MDPDQTARKRRLVQIYAGRKPIMLVLSLRRAQMILLNIFIECMDINVTMILVLVILLNQCKSTLVDDYYNMACSVL
jgi:hypothetical protein